MVPHQNKTYVAYIDIGTIGIWGAGHANVSDSIRIKHIDMHLKHFKNSLLVANDDMGPEVFPWTSPNRFPKMNIRYSYP